MPKKSVKKSWQPGRKQLLIYSAITMVSLLVIMSQANLATNYRSNAQTVTNCTVDINELAVDSQEQAMLDLINNYRQQHALPPLTMSPNLLRAATWQTIDMSSRNSLSHIDSLNRSLGIRINNCGYNGNATAENIAREGPAEDTFQGWVGSPTHNANMLNSQFAAVGIAKKGDYWTVDFGSTNDSSITPNPSQPEPTYGTIAPCPSCASPSTAVPSTATPSEVPAPTNIPEPSEPEEDEEELPQLTPSAAPGQQNPPPSGNNGGLIAILLAFLQLILAFFMSLFGK